MTRPLPSAASGGGHYLNDTAVIDVGRGPRRTSHDLTVERDRDSSRLDVKSSQQFFDRSSAVLMIDAIDLDHATLSQKRNTSSEASGANVTPWR